ncbi:hypothetical protein K491DRAFT_392766 [Lophiostoma macrostomum CBS 122681]|uniref:Zn(2)-C6 fungal-type domain-containing protein n=1 Tax=Lophiostoma macrostomum CBS 122681 TaxID=1314788 RepID=A0A6A6TBL5_9PLEO|nr:hypothetical protein K491DRAFT_392766 [Lophiostoma macrostomum CBS 122681]
MVYSGRLSRGCERCRQRKVKCDQKKPACEKCTRLNLECPGYRDLQQVMFRDQSASVVERAQKRQLSEQVMQKEEFTKPNLSTNLVECSSSHQLPISPCHAIEASGAAFFFAQYTIFNEPPFTGTFHNWVYESYCTSDSKSFLRLAIEAVGTAGLSNGFFAPHVAKKSREKYGKALSAVNKALDDTAQVYDDSTLLTIILLGIYEMVNLDTWENFDSWFAHVRAATTLMELRGQRQFVRERSGQLFIWIRTQMLTACLQHHERVPTALVNSAKDFASSALRQQWRHRHIASPGSITEISFRLVNLRAAIKDGSITDINVIRQIVTTMNEDLTSWETSLSPSWAYTETDTKDPYVMYLGEKRPGYPNLWIADIWNNWRVLRILVYRYTLRQDGLCTATCQADKVKAHLMIQRYSMDICNSVPCFVGNPRFIALIRPLYAVAVQRHNDEATRRFAIETLRVIDDGMGVRQARLLADTATEKLRSGPSYDTPCQMQVDLSHTTQAVSTERLSVHTDSDSNLLESCFD